MSPGTPIILLAAVLAVLIGAKLGLCLDRLFTISPSRKKVKSSPVTRRGQEYRELRRAIRTKMADDAAALDAYRQLRETAQQEKPLYQDAVWEPRDHR